MVILGGFYPVPQVDIQVANMFLDGDSTKSDGYTMGTFHWSR